MLGVQSGARLRMSTYAQPDQRPQGLDQGWRSAELNRRTKDEGGTGSAAEKSYV